MRKRAFTLVELLVVIAIISVLSALLLATLKAVGDTAKRTVCMSNLRQIYVGAMAYAADYSGCAPYQWSYTADPPMNDCAGGRQWGWDAGLSTEEDMYSSFRGSDTGWKIFINNAYMTRGVVRCPSQPEDPQFDYDPANKMRGVHYSFRYNSWRCMWYGDMDIYNLGKGGGCWGVEFAKRPPNGLLTRNKLKTEDPLNPSFDRLRTALFTDAANRRRREDTKAINLTNVDAYNLAWAHRDGGLVITHSGVCVWVKNRTSWSAFSPGFPRTWYAWYGYGWTAGIDIEVH